MPAANRIWNLACPWRTRTHISLVLRHAQTHVLTHTGTRAPSRTRTHCAYGRAAAAKGRNMRKLMAKTLTVVYSDQAEPKTTIVRSPVFSPNGTGWEVSGLPRVIPTLTKGPRLQL